MSDPVLCFHPNAVTEYRERPGRWAKEQAGRRWRMRWRPPQGVHSMRCPACPATMLQLDAGMAMRMVLGPWLMAACDAAQPAAS